LNIGCEMDVIGCTERREPLSRRSSGPRSLSAPNWGRFSGQSRNSQFTPEPIRRTSGFYRIVSKSEQQRRTGSDRLYPNVAGSASRVVFLQDGSGSRPKDWGRN
jgi:hypothetical protein